MRSHVGARGVHDDVQVGDLGGMPELAGRHQNSSTRSASISSGRDTLGCLTCRARKKRCSAKIIDRQVPARRCPECVKLGIYCGGWEHHEPGVKRNKALIRRVKNALRVYTNSLKLNGKRDAEDDAGPLSRLLSSLAGYEPYFGPTTASPPASPATITTDASTSPPASVSSASDAFFPPISPSSPPSISPTTAQAFSPLNDPNNSSQPHPAFYSFAQHLGLDNTPTVNLADTMLSMGLPYSSHDGPFQLDTLEQAPTFFDVDSWINFDPDLSFNSGN